MGLYLIQVTYDISLFKLCLIFLKDLPYLVYTISMKVNFLITLNTEVNFQECAHK